MARYADAVQGIEGHPAPVFPNLAHDYNAIIRRLDPYAANPETWTAAAKSMKTLYATTSRVLDGESTIDLSTGLIVEPAPLLGNVLRTTRGRNETKKKRGKIRGRPPVYGA